MARFAFRFDPLYRALAAPFGVTPQTTMVEVAGERLTVRFGPWLVRTPLSNVAGTERSGPFSLPKTAGPAHLSLADRGLTCATNGEEGVCIRFHQPVAGMDPLGLLRHPGITVTVDRPDELERAVDGEVHGEELRRVSAGVAGESPWQRLGRWARWPAGMALATARHLVSAGDVVRSHRTESRPPPEIFADTSGDGLQPRKAGVGPTFDRRYRVRIAGSRLTPEELVAKVVGNLNAVAPAEVAEFVPRSSMAGTPGLGDELVVRMPGPWEAPVRLVERNPSSFRLAALEGHMEAGQIEFRAWWDGPLPHGSEGPSLLFEIHSLARSRGHRFGLLYDRLWLGSEMQTHMWVHFCRRIADLTGGEVAGPLEVETVRYAG